MNLNQEYAVHRCVHWSQCLLIYMTKLMIYQSTVGIKEHTDLLYMISLWFCILRLSCYDVIPCSTLQNLCVLTHTTNINIVDVVVKLGGGTHERNLFNVFLSLLMWNMGQTIQNPLLREWCCECDSSAWASYPEWQISSTSSYIAGAR